MSLSPSFYKTDIYKKLGLPRVINARGYFTPTGSSLMAPETIEAMAEAAKAHVVLTDLRKKVGEVITRVTGAEAGAACAGASAGLAICAAACMAGKDPWIHEQLPNTVYPKRLKNEFIVQHQQFIHHLKRIELAGGKIVRVGWINECKPSWIEGHINENTAAIFYSITYANKETDHVVLQDLIEIAHRHEIPVIVDSAVSYDITYPARMGADLAVTSGGKALRGPSPTGIIYGRKDLIEACEMTTGILARCMKVGKEELVALMTALELYEKKDWDAEYAGWRKKMKYIYDKLTNPPIPHVRVEWNEYNYTPYRTHGAYCNPPYYTPVIPVDLVLDQKALGMTAMDVYKKLMQGDPAVLVKNMEHIEGILGIGPCNLLDGEEKIVAERIRGVLTKK